MKFTSTSWSWPVLPFEDVVHIMSVLGFRAIDVSGFAGLGHFEPDEIAGRPLESAADLQKIGERYEMVFSDLFVTFGPDLVTRSVNCPDKAVRDANLETMRRICEFCNRALIPGITLCPGVEHAALGRQASLDLAVHELARLAEAGRAANLRVSFEPHLESITESIEDARMVVTSVPHLSLTLDYSHFVAQGYSESAIETLLPYAGHIHVRQARKSVLQAHDDDGTIDFVRMLTGLERYNYSGRVAYEYECNSWQGNHRSDVVTETVLLRNHAQVAHARSSG